MKSGITGVVARCGCEAHSSRREIGPMTKNPESALLKRRTHAMAWVFLTDRDDLTVMDVGDDSGIDLLVSIRKDKVRAIEQFGVILQGTVEKANTPQAACQILHAMMPKGRRFASISMPIC